MSIAWSISVPTETWESATASGRPVGPILPLLVAGSNYCLVAVAAADHGAATPPTAASWTSWANIVV